jgi:hypothetical protein
MASRMSAKPQVPAVFWWRSLSDTFENVCREFIARAQKAELAAKGHECGHEWTITIESRGHSSGIYGEPDSPHSDAKYTDTSGPVIVRAHNLRDALLVAATLPLNDWLPEDTTADDS